MGTIKRFEDLEVWQKARSFAKVVYGTTKKGTFSRDFELRHQINRSAGSLMDNIVEGFERDGRQEFVQFLSIAKSSCGEARSQLYRAFDREHLSEEELNDLVDESVTLGKMLAGFINYLRHSGMRGTKFRNSNISESD